MLRTHLKTSVRFFARNRVFTLLNFLGLVMGFTASLLLLSYISFQLGYDSFHKDASMIFRAQLGESDISQKTQPALSRALQELCNECLTTRLKSAGGSIGTDVAPFRDEKIYWTDDSFLSLFTYPLEKGIPEQALQRPNTAVISRKLSGRLFGVNVNPVGKTFTFSDINNQ